MAEHTVEEQDRIDDLKAVAADSIKAIELALPDVASDTSRALLMHQVKALRATLDRFITDTQPIDVPDSG